MEGFRYKYGDRPLEGYAIQRAVGRGGFGEVYYAVSDAGREVALKVIQGYEQIELRGVSACMNLKSPHLVNIFDVRHNDQGEPFVIMEYVAGPSLRELLDASPAGLGPQKAAFFLREIAKGLTYLHDRGIVHRDLKPGNIFYEDGFVKIGDYGLSKAMAASRHSGQTITVGTVHYMAPEIGQGKYDASIDVYALGCVLYEMLTGQTPFLGGSPGEILMKHLMAEPDVKDIEEPFTTVIRKAMAKEPADRYRSAQEMVEAVFGTEHIRNSVSHFRPESLSMVAERVAQKVTVGGGSSADANRLGGQGGYGTGSLPDEPWDHFSNRMQELGRRWERAGDRLSRKMQRLSERFTGRAAPTEIVMPQVAKPAAGVVPVNDPLTWNQRRLLAVITALFVAAGSGALTEYSPYALGPFEALLSFVLITAAAGGILGSKVVFSPAIESEPLLGRAVYGMMGCAYAAMFLLVAAVPYSLIRGAATSGGDLKYVLACFIPFVMLCASLGTLVLKGLVRNGMVGARNEMGRAIYIVPLVSAAVVLGVLAAFMGNVPIYHRMSGTLLACGIMLLLMNWRKLTAPQRRSRISLRWAIIAGFLAFVLGEACDGEKIVAAGVMAGTVLVAQILAPFGPVAAMLSAASAGAAAAVGATASPGRGPRSSPFSPRPQGTDAAASPPKPADGLTPLANHHCSDRLRGEALLLACVGFVFPLAGLHRFYVGKIGTGLLWLCTLGFMYVGTIFDVICIALGAFHDKQGRRLLVWWNLNELSGVIPPTAAQPGIPATSSGTVPIDRPHRSLANASLAFLGSIVLLTAFVIGLAAALNLPAVVAAGWPDRQLAADLYKLFGYSGWPQLLLKLFWTSSTVLMVIGALFVLIARRGQGVAHVSRAALGAIAMFVSLQLLGQALVYENWPLILDMFDQHRAGPAIETFIDATRSNQSVAAGALVIGFLLLFAWPVRKPSAKPPFTGGQGQGVSS
jgi:hypothetical protein